MVSGAIESVYQVTRIQQICAELGLWVFNPLWKIDPVQYLRTLVEEGFDVRIVGVFAYPLTEEWLGRRIDAETIEELEALSEEHGIQPSGEGGELETSVLSAPGWEKRLEIVESEKAFGKNAGILHIRRVEVRDR